MEHDKFLRFRCQHHRQAGYLPRVLTPVYGTGVVPKDDVKSARLQGILIQRMPAYRELLVIKRSPGFAYRCLLVAMEKKNSRILGFERSPASSRRGLDDAAEVGFVVGAAGAAGNNLKT